MNLASLNRIKVTPIDNDISPVVLDYDFKNHRPRGGSAKVDIFCYGGLDKSFDSVKIQGNVFVRKDIFFFKHGIFLTDFSQLLNNHKPLAQMIRKLTDKTIFLENSCNFSIDKLISDIYDREIILLDFYRKS